MVYVHVASSSIYACMHGCGRGLGMINSVRFNQDCTCFTVAHSRGFRVYNADPLESWVSRELEDGRGCYSATVLERTNYLVLVCSDGQKEGPQSSIVVWNDLEQKGTTVTYESRVLNTLVNRDVVVAVLESAVYISTLAAPHHTLLKIKTFSNPHGVAALCNATLVLPGVMAGDIQVVNVSSTQCEVKQVINCHRSTVRAIAISDEYIATASTTGTLIRVQARKGGEPQFFRRGLDRATIWSLALNPTKLAVLSDKGTLHVYDLGGSRANERHSLAKIPLAPRYFGDEWSSARAKTGAKTQGIVGWVNANACVVVRGSDAQWEKYLVADGELVMEAMRHIH